MGISRRIEYYRFCDVPDCYRSEAADWTTRDAAEQAAISDGWVKLTRNRWMCPDCKKEAEAAHNAWLAKQS